MLMILARLVRSESFWAVAKVRSPHTGPGIRYIIAHEPGNACTHRPFAKNGPHFWTLLGTLVPRYLGLSQRLWLSTLSQVP